MDEVEQATPPLPPRRSTSRLSRRRLRLAVALSLLAAVCATLSMYSLAQSFLGIPVPSSGRLYVSGHWWLGEYVLALDAAKAIPWSMFTFVAPLAAIATLSLTLSLRVATRLSERSKPTGS